MCLSCKLSVGTIKLFGMSLAKNHVILNIRNSSNFSIHELFSHQRYKIKRLAAA